MAKLSNCDNNPNFWIRCMQLGHFMGCHQRSDRSFFYKNKQFPICARCTGVIIGEFCALVFFLCKIRISLLICLVLCGIMFGDWLVQKMHLLQSTNKRRLITGILGGYGYMTIVCKIILWLCTRQ